MKFQERGMRSFKTALLKTTSIKMESGAYVETISAADLYRASGKSASHAAWFRNYIKKLNLIRGRDYVYTPRVPPSIEPDCLVTTGAADRIIASMYGVAAEPVPRLGGYQQGSVVNLPAFLPTPAEPPRDIEPVVRVDGERVFADSRDVAATFGKKHRHVLDAIRDLIDKAGEIRLPIFRQSIFQNEQRRAMPCFEMDRDGFSLLVMGFTGDRALRWKLKYIEAFNKMETEIRVRNYAAPKAPIDLRDPDTLLALLAGYAADKKALQADNYRLGGMIAEQRPKVEAFDAFLNIDDTLLITDAAKKLNMSRFVLFDWMRNNGWLFKNSERKCNRAREEKLKAGFLVHQQSEPWVDDDGKEHIKIQARVTPTGSNGFAANCLRTNR